jgi:hypothetical protein
MAPARFFSWDQTRTTRRQVNNVERIGTHSVNPDRLKRVMDSRVKKHRSAVHQQNRGKKDPLRAQHPKFPSTAPAVRDFLLEIGTAYKRCEYCGKEGGCANPNNCYSQLLHMFHHVDTKLIELRQTLNRGIGVFTQPGKTIEKDQPLGIYIGELKEADERPANTYAYTANMWKELDIKALIRIDSEKKGNFTRFINHACEPNVAADVVQVGGKVVVLFKATKRIRENTELTINYSKEYFTTRNMKCRCSRNPAEHNARDVENQTDHWGPLTRESHMWPGTK